MRLQRHPAIKMPARPAAGLAPPVDRMLGAGGLPPAPALLAPPLPPLITAVIDKLRELRLAHRRPRDGKRLHFDRMCPLLVVENKRLVRRGAQPERATRDRHIARQRSAAEFLFSSGSALPGVGLASR